MDLSSVSRPGACRLRPLLVASLLLATAGPAAAQQVQYMPAGQFDLESGSAYQAIDGAVQSSQWKLGRLYIAPELGIRDLAYVSDLSSGNLLAGGGIRSRREPDLTASFVAGLKGYVPIGRRYAFAVHALPEYSWWQDSKERRRLNGRYGAGFFGGLGRSELELSVTRDEGVRFFSREFEEQVTQQRDTAEADFQIAVVGAFSFYGNARLRKQRLIRKGQEDLIALANTDRDEQRVGAGVRYRFVAGPQLGIGFENVEVDFELDNDRRFTSIDGIVLSLSHSSPRWGVRADVAFEKVAIGVGPAPSKQDETRGRLRFDKPLGDRLGLQLYADRNLVFSVQESSPFFDDTRVGLALRTSNQARFGVRVFGETGSNEFASFDTLEPGRSDDFQAFGADIVLHLGSLQLRFGATTTDYNSNIPEFDRRVTTSRLSINFTFSRGGLAVGTRGLRLGGGDIGPWT